MLAKLDKSNLVAEGTTRVEGAVMGIVDMIDSTVISNCVDVETDFQLKRSFVSQATLRAQENDITILHHTGDGFLFIANLSSKMNWQENLLNFYRQLSHDFSLMISELRARTGIQVESGLRFGVARGNVVLGSLSSQPGHYTAVGATVNLAARVCSIAEANQIVFCSSTWQLMEMVATEEISHSQSYLFKGFSTETEVVRIRHRRPRKAHIIETACAA